MNINSIRLGFNLFAQPVLLLICSLCAQNFAGLLNASPYLLVLTTFVDWGIKGALLISSFWILSSCWRLWGAFRGVGENCHACGMPTKLIDPGKYSPHYRCMACGLNRKAYF